MAKKVKLVHNSLVFKGGTALVISKEQVVQVGSEVETANGNKYIVEFIDNDKKVYVTTP